MMTNQQKPKKPAPELFLDAMVDDRVIGSDERPDFEALLRGCGILQPIDEKDQAPHQLLGAIQECSVHIDQTAAEIVESEMRNTPVGLKKLMNLRLAGLNVHACDRILQIPLSDELDQRAREDFSSTVLDHMKSALATIIEMLEDPELSSEAVMTLKLLDSSGARSIRGLVQGHINKIPRQWRYSPNTDTKFGGEKRIRLGLLQDALNILSEDPAEKKENEQVPGPQSATARLSRCYSLASCILRAQNTR